MTEPTTNPPPHPPPRLRFGLQVAIGFFAPIVAGLLCALVTALVAGHGRSPAATQGIAVLGSLLPLAVLVGLVILSLRPGWKGIGVGLILFGSLVVLAIAACFGILFFGFRHMR